MKTTLHRALKRTAALATLGFLSLSTANVQAVIMTSGCADTDVSCTLGELFTGGSIIIDDKLFDDWALRFDDSTETVNFANIDILALDDQPLNQGLQWNANGELSSIEGTVINLGLSYTVSTLDGSARIKDNSLEMNEFEFDIGNTGGLINIFENVYDAAGNFIGFKLVSADNLYDNFYLFDSAEFSPQSQITVYTSILIEGDGSGDRVYLDTFTQRFSQVAVPEPTTLALLSLGLVGLGFTRRRMKA